MFTAAKASIMPKPETSSYPAVSMSIAVVFKAVCTCATVKVGFFALRIAAMAAACGAAAEVP